MMTRDPDIGRCDDCGSEDGQRRRTPRTITVAGVRELVDVWLCSHCRDREGDR